MMFNETSGAFLAGPAQIAGIVQIHEESGESNSLTAGTIEACQRALQALRDVRHLLPLEGVAIVDAVLDFAC